MAIAAGAQGPLGPIGLRGFAHRLRRPTYRQVGHLRWPDSQGREVGRFTGDAIQEIPTGHQP
jgi:hypothetical protein